MIDERKHETSPACWCRPTLDFVDPKTGNQVWVHYMRRKKGQLRKEARVMAANRKAGSRTPSA
jgi:hypothetical protein